MQVHARNGNQPSSQINPHGGEPIAFGAPLTDDRVAAHDRNATYTGEGAEQLKGIVSLEFRQDDGRIARHFLERDGIRPHTCHL
jgi:hypothetical protein